MTSATLEVRAGYRYRRLHTAMYWLALRSIRRNRPRLAAWLLNHGHRFIIRVGEETVATGPAFIASFDEVSGELTFDAGAVFR